MNVLSLIFVFLLQVFPTPGSDDVITEICVSLWHDNFFLGEVRLPLETHQHRAALNTNAWLV